MQKTMYDAHGRIDHAVLCDAITQLPINEYFTVEDASRKVGLAKNDASHGAVSTALLVGYELGNFVRRSVDGRIVHRRTGKFENGQLYDGVLVKRKKSLGQHKPKFKMAVNEPTVIRAEDKTLAPDEPVAGGAVPALRQHLENASIAAGMLTDELKLAEAAYNRLRRVIG